MDLKADGAQRFVEASYRSRSLKREQPYAYLLPPSFTVESSRRYPLLVLLHGVGSDHLGWLTHTRIARYAAAYDLVVACPNGGNGWYTNAYDGSSCYEDDLVTDFVEHLRATLPLHPPGKRWGIGGLSMGGYGAIKTALKHPALFSVGVSHSGAFDCARQPVRSSIFGDPVEHSALRRASNVFALAEDALSRWPSERPRLALDCGVEDELIETSRQLHHHLNFIGYPHLYREMPGYHTWPYWDRALRTVLPTAAEWLGAIKEEAEGVKPNSTAL